MTPFVLIIDCKNPKVISHFKSELPWQKITNSSLDTLAGIVSDDNKLYTCLLNTSKAHPFEEIGMMIRRGTGRVSLETLKNGSIIESHSIN